MYGVFVYWMMLDFCFNFLKKGLDVVRAAVSVWRKSMAMTSLSWLKAREFFLEKDDSHRGGRRPVSRKYRNVKKNISRKKEKKRISLRHRRSRRRLRRHSHSLCLKKLILRSHSLCLKKLK